MQAAFCGRCVMPHHRWLALLTVAFALQTLGFLGPLVADEADKSDKGKEDTLIAAMKFVKVPHGTFWMGGELSLIHI